MIFSKPPYKLKPLLTCMLIVVAPFSMAETKQNVVPKKAQVVADNNEPVEMPEMTVTATKPTQFSIAPTAKERYRLPTTTESVTREKINDTINVMTAEDTIKYLPSIQVRRRYIGDTNAPVGWRTSGTSASARGLIYADGILISTLLGNNNSNTGSPRWNMVSPNEIDRVDVMYGPFAAAYAGNSIGGVINMVTKMPDKFEAALDVKSAWQDYGFYGKDQTFSSQAYTANLGNRHKDFSWRFDYSHLDSHSQPITFVNPVLSTTKAAASDIVVTGAVSNANPYGVSAVVLGSSTLNHTLQDNFKWKMAYDITPTIRASYTLGLWLNENNAGFSSFLRDSAGNVVNSGNVNIGLYVDRSG